MKILGIGSIIEFKDKNIDKPISETTHIDRVSTIHLQQNGDVHYWTELYPELCFCEPEITPDRLVRCIEEVEYHNPKLLEFPCSVGDLISFEWDDEKILHGKVNEVYHTIDLNGVGWRVCVGTDNYSLADDDDHKIKIEKD